MFFAMGGKYVGRQKADCLVVHVYGCIFRGVSVIEPEQEEYCIPSLSVISLPLEDMAEECLRILSDSLTIRSARECESPSHRKPSTLPAQCCQRCRRDSPAADLNRTA